MNMKLSNLVEMIGKKPLAPGTTHLVVELLVSDQEGEDVDVSQHTLLFYTYSLSLLSHIGSLHSGLHLDGYDEQRAMQIKGMYTSHQSSSLNYILEPENKNRIRRCSGAGWLRSLP
jgi:hypothetical protein